MPKKWSQKVNISTFEANDLSALRLHLQNCWQETYEPVFGSAVTQKMIEPLSSETLADVVPQEDETTLVARVGDGIVGCAVIAERYDMAYLWGVYVASAWQRKGVGKALVHHAASLVEEAHTIQVTVLTASEPAVMFYRSLGFSTDKTIQFDLTSDFSAEAYIMNARSCTLKTEV